MKKLGIFIVIVLTLILTIPNISFAQQFVDSEHFGTYHSRSYYGHRSGDDRYSERHDLHESQPYYYEEANESQPYYYEYYESPSTYYYVPGPFYYAPYGYGSSVDLN